MKKTLLFLLIVFVTAILTVNSTAYAATEFSDGFYTFTVTENDTAVVTDCNLTEETIKVPGDILGYPVVGIGDYAFFGNSYIKNFELPVRLLSIGEFAFANNTGLESVTIHDMVQSIAENAFWNSPNVTIYCYYGTAAHTYAAEKHIPCVLLDGITLGNVNGDSYISIGDVTAIQRHIAELDTLEGISLLAADIDSDGAIEIDDATALQMYIAGFESPYPIGEPIRLDNTIE